MRKKIRANCLILHLTVMNWMRFRGKRALFFFNPFVPHTCCGKQIHLQFNFLMKMYTRQLVMVTLYLHYISVVVFCKPKCLYYEHQCSVGVKINVRFQDNFMKRQLTEVNIWCIFCSHLVWRKRNATGVPGIMVVSAFRLGSLNRHEILKSNFMY